ncbi:FliH/SctL family protein [Falsirhodobacter xinxiangensis]|uniref:FliH/SctL family protein n=1 Tax=Falsirhodobacter xinxiangensis TaxID=2530049 RepID=UPI0010A9AD4A|nr:FliH/SctL family protein [Rhodobacter xinxiangensis]
MTLPDRPTARVIRAAEAEAWQDGFAFLSRAKDEAAALRATVDAEIAAARDEGRAHGRQQGETDAATLLLATQAQVDRYLAGIEPQLVDLTFRIIDQILDGATDAELIARATRRALQTFRGTEAITLSVPEPALAEVEAQLRGLDLRVTADRHLTGRQCILSSPASSIDISIDAQLQAIRTAMGAA